MQSYAQRLFHFICVKEYQKSEDYDEEYFRKGLSKSEKFFDRFDGQVNFTQKSVLDVGCGFGDMCIYMALNGAKKVVGIDIDEHRINFASSKLASNYKELSSIVEFHLVSGLDFGHREFDIVLSKDSFEHYSDPKNVIHAMKQHVKAAGNIVIGFGPLWKAPNGGHISFMTKVPWAHLVFPESVIMAERKRFRPDDDVKSFAQVRGGLNKMTLDRYLRIIKESGLEIQYFKTNVSCGRRFNIPARFPFLREYFTLNVYTILCIRV